MYIFEVNTCHASTTEGLVYVAKYISRLLKLMILKRMYEIQTKSTLKALNLMLIFECLAFQIQTLTFKEQLRVGSCVLKALNYMRIKLVRII